MEKKFVGLIMWKKTFTKRKHGENIYYAEKTFNLYINNFWQANEDNNIGAHNIAHKAF